jgi:hypothetical protein
MGELGENRTAKSGCATSRFPNDSRALHRRKLASGDKCPDEIALGDREQEMRRAVGIVVDGNLRIAGARDMADSDQFEIILGDVIVRALDFDSDALSRFEQDSVGADFNIKFIDLVRF